MDERCTTQPISALLAVVRSTEWKGRTRRPISTAMRRGRTRFEPIYHQAFESENVRRQKCCQAHQLGIIQIFPYPSRM